MVSPGPDHDVVIVGAGFAGCCAGHALAGAGFRVTLVDRRDRFPDLFRAEKIEPDQADLMRDLGLLGMRRPYSPAIGTVRNFQGGQVEAFDTIEQYGIDYSDTVRSLRTELPPAVRQLHARVESVVAGGGRPLVSLSDGATLRPWLVVLASGGSDRLLDSLGVERAIAPELTSLSFGFDLEVETDGPFVGFNHFIPPNPERIDYLTVFPIGDRVRANLFTQSPLSAPFVQHFKREPETLLEHNFPGLQGHIGQYRVSGRVQVVPTVFATLRRPERPGVVVIGDEFQAVSPTTGTGLSKVLNDVVVLRDHATRWKALSAVPTKAVRMFYRDQQKRLSDRKSLGAWQYYHDRQFTGGSISLRERLRRHTLWRARG